MYQGCPILWVSKMQTQCALSTMESEYLALSQSMRDLIPLRETLKEINKVDVFLPPSPYTMTMLEAGADILNAFCAVTPRAQLLTWIISYSIPFLSNPRIGIMLALNTFNAVSGWVY